MKDNQAKYPQLRFNGFTDPWEERKLGDLADFNPKSVLPETFEYVDLESVVGTDIISHRLEYKNSAPSRAQRLAQKGDVFYQTVRPYQKNNCIFDKLDNDWVFSTGYAQLRPKKDSYFLLVLLQNNSFMRKVLGRCTGTSYPAINSKDLAQIKVSISDSIDEQKKIGNLFRNIDNTIALHQRKLAMLKELKQGYLQKLFPQNGSKFPQLRFAGFADAWEERKFKDNIVSIQTGTNLLGSAVNEGTPLIKMGNLQRGYFSFKKLEYLDSNSNVGSEDIVNYGDFLFNTRNTLELVGKGATWTGISGKYAFNSNIARFKFDGIDTIFFNYLYNTQQVISQVHARAVGTTSVSAVYPRDLNSLLYYLPSIEEQQKIGSFFKQLDDTITLHQRKLEKLQELKKGYLQKMFC